MQKKKDGGGKRGERSGGEREEGQVEGEYIYVFGRGLKRETQHILYWAPEVPQSFFPSQGSKKRR